MIQATFPEGLQPDCSNILLFNAVKNDDLEAFKAANVTDPLQEISFNNAPQKSMIKKHISIISLCLLYNAKNCTSYLIGTFGDKILLNGKAAISYVAASGNLDMYKKMVSMNRNLIKDLDGCLYAAKFNKLNIIQYIFLNAPPGTNFFVPGSDSNPLIWAAQNDAVDVVKFFVENDIYDVNHTTIGFWSALNCAAASNCIETVKYLVEVPGIKNTKNRKGNTPIKTAILNGCAASVKILIEHGFEETPEGYIDDMLLIFDRELPKQANEVDSATEEQKLECIRVFLRDQGALKYFGGVIFYKTIDRAFYNAIDKVISQTPSVETFQYKVLSLICEEAKQNKDLLSQEEFMKLMSQFVKEPRALYIIDNLFSIPTFDPNWKDENGKNLIHYALVKGNEEMVKKLIAQNVNPNQRDNTGKRMIQYAAAVSEAMLKVIIESPQFDKSELFPDVMNLLNPQPQ